jgi:hypothetical protein
MVKTLVVVALLLWPFAAANLPAAPLAAAQGAQVSPIEGVWIYAKDPKGVVRSEAIYEGSTITFGAGGKYAFQLGETSIALQGTWEVRGAKGDIVRVHTEYGRDRSNDLTLTIRRDAGGKVVGLEVREGDGSTGARYYVPRAK